MLIWVIRTLSFSILILTFYATVNIFQSIWFRFWSSRYMDEQQKREFHVKNRYEVKWSFSFTVMSLLGFVLFQLIGLEDLSWWYLLCAFLFGFLFWGCCRTLGTLKDYLKVESDRKEKRKLFNLDS